MDLGYDSPNALIGLGTLSFLIIFYYLKILFFVILMIWVDLTKGKYGGISLLTFMKKTLFFKEIIGLSIESYFEFLIYGYMIISYPIRTTVGEWFSLFLGVNSAIFLIIIFPILFIYLMYLEKKNFEIIN